MRIKNEINSKKASLKTYMWLTLIAIMLPLSAIYYFDIDQRVELRVFIDISKIIYSLFFIIAFYLIPVGYNFLANRVVVMLSLCAFLVFLFVTSRFVGELNYFYVPMWLASLLFFHLNDKKVKHRSRVSEQ